MALTSQLDPWAFGKRGKKKREIKRNESANQTLEHYFKRRKKNKMALKKIFLLNKKR